MSQTYVHFTRSISKRSTSALRVSCVFVLCLTWASGVSAQQPATLNTGAISPALGVALPDAPSTSADVQSSSFAGELGRGVVTVGKDELTFIKAPFHKKSIPWDIGIGAAAAALISTDVSVAHQVNPAWHDSSMSISNALLYSTVAGAGGIFVTGLVTDNEHAKDTGVAAARGAADSAILYYAMKVMFNRERPYSGRGDGSFFSGNFSSGSFPSGHSTFTWTLASVIAHEYPKWPVALLMYGMATTVSTARVTGGQHFPSDVVTGGAFGYLIGRYVAKQDNHLPGGSHPKNKMLRMEDAVLSHVSIGVQ